MTYNTSFVDSCNDIVCAAQGINTASDGWFIGILLVVVWLMIIIGMIARNREWDNALLASSAIVALLAGTFFGVGLIGGWTLSFPIAMIFISLVIKLWR